MTSFAKTKNSAIITMLDAITLLTLADATALKQDAPLAITQDFRLLALDLSATWTGSTLGDGPVHYGIANDNLTVAEIRDAINADGPLGPGDATLSERAERGVFVLGTMFNGQASQGNTNFSMKRHKIRWTFYSGDGGFSFFAFNASGGALTTGGIIRLLAKLYGVWVV